MSVDYINVWVSPSIPTKCLAEIEAWLLRRYFEINETKDDMIFFHSSLDVYECVAELNLDKDLDYALAASRQVCPELCAAVQREVERKGSIVRDEIEYETILQSIIRRHPDVLRHISIVETVHNTRSLFYEEILTLITATAIESIWANHKHENGAFRNVEISRKSGSLDPSSPYILPFDSPFRSQVQ